MALVLVDRNVRPHVTVITLNKPERLNSMSFPLVEALYEVTGLHRLARDVRAGALNYAVAFDEAGAQYSRVRWGLEPQTLLY